MQDIIVEKASRVSAKYIRKMATRYGIEIKGTLRSAKAKNKYLELIVDEIIAEEVRNEIKEQNIAYLKELNAVLKDNPRFLAYDIKSLPFKASIQCGHKKVGEVGVNILGNVWYRTFLDGRSVQRSAKSITEATKTIIQKIFSNLQVG